MNLEKVHKNIAIYTLTSKGAELGQKIREFIGGDLYVHKKIKKNFDSYCFNKLSSLVSKTFSMYKEHIFITAMGIAVRSIAPHIVSKETDPAVVVLDQNARYCISLLSGHIGGANELCNKIAKHIKATPVITTATDTEGLTPVDMIAKKKGMYISNIYALKEVSSAMLEGDSIQLFDPNNIFPLNYPYIITVKKEIEWNKHIPGIWISYKKTDILKKKLIIVPRILVVGIGCNKGIEKLEIKRALETVFQRFNLNLHAINSVATINKKKCEKGLLEFINDIKIPINFFSSEELSLISVPNPSKFSKKYMGTESVCEASAIISAKMGNLLVPKQKFKNVTIAVALKKKGY